MIFLHSVMGVYVMVFLVLIFGIEKGFSIECYSCSSKITEDCIKPYKSGIPLRKCNLIESNTTRMYAEQLDPSFSKYFQLDLYAHEPQVPMNCLKQETKVGNQKYVIRGCQLAAIDSMDVCIKIKKEINKDYIHTMHCSLCNSDACNRAPARTIFFTDTSYSVFLILSSFTLLQPILIR